jgi:ribose/xylose/arabinose/galactoside ABC-type transport system permease subunit
VFTGAAFVVAMVWRRRVRPVRGYKGLVMMVLIALAVGLLIGLFVGALLEGIGLEPFAFLIHPTS